MKMNKIWMWAIAAGAGYAIYKMTQKDEAPAVAIPEASETTFTAAPVPVVQPDQVIHAPKIAQTAAPAARRMPVQQALIKLMKAEDAKKAERLAERRKRRWRGGKGQNPASAAFRKKIEARRAMLRRA